MSRADDFMLTDYELRMRKQKRRRRLVIAVAVAAALLLAFFAARPTFRAIKAWQARRHAKTAFALIEQEKWKEARESAVAAYQLRGTEPQAIRAVARLLSRTGQQQALEFWDQLAAKESLTRDDLRDLAMVAMAAGDHARSEKAIEQLLAPGSGQATPSDWLLAARVAAQRRDFAGVLSYVDKILAAPDSSERQQFQAAMLGGSVPHGTPEEMQRRHADTWSRIVQLSQSQSATGLDALLVLAQQAVARSVRAAGAQAGNASTNAREGESAVPVPSPDAELPDNVAPPDALQAIPAIAELADAIERHPLAQPMHKLSAVDLRTHVNPSERDALIDGAIAQWKDADAAGRAALAAWLNGKAQHERVLALFPLERSMETPEAFLQHVDALGGLGRWEEIRQLLESERFPLEPVLQRMYLARCNAQLGKKTAAENNWQRALETAGAEVPKLMMLAEYAEKNGALTIAEAAYNAAAAAAPKLRAAQQGRLRAAQRARDTKRMHEILAAMLQLWPNDVAIQNDEAYTRLLLIPNDTPDAEQLIEIERIAERLLQTQPASLPHRTLLALARLKQNRPVAALETYQNIQVSPDALTPSALAVHAAVLSANGEREAARTEIRQAAVEQLLPEEHEATASLRQ